MVVLTGVQGVVIQSALIIVMVVVLEDVSRVVMENVKGDGGVLVTV